MASKFNLDKFASDYAQSADVRDRILIQCRLAHEGMAGVEPGKAAQARRIELAQAVSAAIATRLYGDDEAMRAVALTIPSNRPGGATVSHTAIAQRADAYSDVLSAGLTPDITNVSAAFRLSSIGGNKKYRDAVQKAVSEGADFVSATNEAATSLTAANKGKRQPRNAGGSVEFDEGLTADVVVAAVKWATANVESFSDQEKRAIADAMAEFSVLVTL
jgi:hypothetical protein